MPQTTIKIFRQANGNIPVEEWLENLAITKSKVYKKFLQRILLLSEVGFEMDRPLAATLRNGIYELRVKSGRVNYRILYFFSGRNVVVLSHGLTKKKKVPDEDINRAISRKALVKKDPNKYTAEWDDDE